MASYKSAIRTAPANDQSESKFKDKARQLQEFFPAWSHDDLQSLLVEVNGDVEIAATRISDGQAEQWGSVSRKKDKKPVHASKDSFSSAPPTRGDFRGGRGGARGGRGGPARGGGAVRGARGDFRGGRGGHSNGHSRTSSPAVGQSIDNKATDASKPVVENIVNDSTPSTWNEVSKAEDIPSTSGLAPSGSTTSAWGAPTITNAWGTQDTASDATSVHANTTVNGSTSATSPNASAPTSVSAKPISKSPATSKLSWAQIARPQEKPVPPPSAPIVQQQPPPPPPPAPSEPTVTANAPSTTTPVHVPPEPEPLTNTGWEDPTTVQTPSFDEEPSAPVASSEQAKSEQKPESEAAPAPHEPAPSKPSEPAVVEVPASAAPSTPAPPTPAPSTPSKVAARPAAVSQRSSVRHSNYAKIASDQGGVVMPPTPSSIGANLSSISSFGTFGDFKSSGAEKVSMQFGSLSLGGTAEPEPEPEAASPPAPAASTETTTPATQAPTAAPEQTVPSASASLNSGLYQVQTQPLPTSVSQPAVPSSTTPSTNVSASPAQSLQQQSVTSTQPQSLSQLPQQLQQQTTQSSQSLPSHHQYSQHGLPTMKCFLFLFLPFVFLCPISPCSLILRNCLCLSYHT
ncbi:hypothetical protein GYMLUDRAFT_897734 [Collybiopsis luxurians FD-317 M1]|uniref:RNA polymerase II degradation factor 1 n=1 Tax=Collybiopsis luxurians FD-317 M1 TaxID=944289 RepID=A0A0D0BXU1_9AGAR|nr:hypothetical protein GYMLUDRAFT_897734 [Collybiopsis luxurians FD-317 M1]